MQFPSRGYGVADMTCPLPYALMSFLMLHMDLNKMNNAYTQLYLNFSSIYYNFSLVIDSLIYFK